MFGDVQNKRMFTEPGFEFTLDADVPPNTVISFGGLTGVTTEFTPAKKLGWAACHGTFELTAAGYAALTYAKGDVVKITADNNVGTLAQAGTIAIGRAIVGKTSGGTTVTVMLIPHVV